MLKKENLEADTTALEREIDLMVYALYELSAEEISIVKKKNKIWKQINHLNT